MPGRRRLNVDESGHHWTWETQDPCVGSNLHLHLHPSISALESEEEGVAICERQTLNLSPQQKSINSLGGPLKAIFVRWLGSGRTRGCSRASPARHLILREQAGLGNRTWASHCPSLLMLPESMGHCGSPAWFLSPHPEKDPES